MFKYETHMHTSEASACANSSGAEMAEKYKAEGYTGIIVTDHFFNGNSCIPHDLPWKERIELFFLGYEHAKEAGDRIGLDVFFGFEFGGGGGSDYLIYGLDKQWLIEHEYILDMELTEFFRLVRRDGGIIVQAHPFREYDYIRYTILAPKYIDAIEGVNSSHSDPAFNERAKIYAGWYGLPVTSGSDAHNTTNRWYGGGVLSEKRFESAAEYGRAVIAGEIIIIE